MRKIKNRNLAQLLMQLRFTPYSKRKKQLASAEKLFAIIEKQKEYPFEFVCFRITGFRLKVSLDLPPIKGDQLAEDLRIFISKLSSQVADHVGEQSQKIYDTEELAVSLGVSTKTIHRWKKRGLIAKKFIFEDDKKRYGFQQSTLDEFFKVNPNLVNNAKIFTRLSDKHKQQVLTKAAELANTSNLSRRRIISQIASSLGRAHETIRYILVNYEKTNPDKPIFKKPSGVINSVQTSDIYKLHKQGSSITELMRRFNRSKSSIYRIINQRRSRILLARKIEFIDSNEFLEDDSEEKILSKTIALKNFKTSDPLKLAKDSLPDYLQALKEAPLLNREREVELFRRYNYLKYLACKLKTGMHSSGVSSAKLRKIEKYLADAEVIKNMIIEANMRLVVSIANKHTNRGANLLDLVSEGNVSVMRAVEKFDYTRGFRFSTYASWAITKDFARKIPAEITRTGKTKADSMVDIHRDLRITEVADVAAVERARRSLSQVIKEELNEREQYIILNHFGLIGSLIKKEKKTLKQIGEDLDLSKERIRQIELIALQKLRQCLSIEEFELLIR